MNDIKLKLCTMCGEEKPLNTFTNDIKRADGKYQYCKDCVREYHREYAKTPQGTWSGIKGRVTYNKKHKPSQWKPFEISRGDFIEWYTDEPKVCAYCSVKEEHCHIIQELFITHITKLTVDCVDNDMGYVLGNLALACSICNETKRNIFTFEEMRKIGQKYIRPKWEAKLNE